MMKMTVGFSLRGEGGAYRGLFIMGGKARIFI